MNQFVTTRGILQFMLVSCSPATPVRVLDKVRTPPRSTKAAAGAQGLGKIGFAPYSRSVVVAIRNGNRTNIASAFYQCLNTLVVFATPISWGRALTPFHMFSRILAPAWTREVATCSHLNLADRSRYVIRTTINPARTKYPLGRDRGCWQQRDRRYEKCEHRVFQDPLLCHEGRFSIVQGLVSREREDA